MRQQGVHMYAHVFNTINGKVPLILIGPIRVQKPPLYFDCVYWQTTSTDSGSVDCRSNRGASLGLVAILSSIFLKL
ncbi:hypothetical protein BpHYR1_036057 [Brachionus plicatilis]|uniref:Uncharacterized protein n=1 Tax=Brachionus plicatilis TaxID=10195 RepID=A0A3M7RYY3_BRAPC|nr:hypothetical protein BpHYR1_036057 [Brachionus plicatilis]